MTYNISPSLRLRILDWSTADVSALPWAMLSYSSSKDNIQKFKYSKIADDADDDADVTVTSPHPCHQILG